MYKYTDMKQDDIYQEEIIEHYKHPRNRGVLSRYTHVAEGNNATCGDTIKLFLNVSDGGMVENVSFDGDGCAIATAAASLLTEYIRGKNIHEVRSISPGDMYTLLGVAINPARSNCALLAYRALMNAIIETKTSTKK